MQHKAMQHWNDSKGPDEELLHVPLHQRLILALRRSGCEFSNGSQDF
jgi:hypothetical protein